MTRKVLITVALLSTWLQASLIDSAFGWWPIAHYAITEEAGYPDIAPYAQLPDYMESADYWWWNTADGSIAKVSLYFCWSHAAQDAGKTGLTPLKPTYPDDGRYPGPVMWNILQNKMKGVSPEAKAEMERTIKGFVAHNAADRVVHYEFFGGAEEGDGTIAGKDKWEIEHREKERWADYVVFIYVYHDGKESDAFETDGRLKLNFPDSPFSDGIPVAPPTDAMARIMQLGQRAYQKNRRFTEANKDYFILTTQSISTIKSSIQNNINNEVTVEKLNWARRFLDTI